MIADSLPREADVTFLFDRFDQTEIGRASSDIDHQTMMTRLETTGFFLRARGQPAVKSSLRLFQKHEIAQPSIAGSLHGQVSRNVVKRCRHGQNNRLAL